jgi:uncharacterized protein
VKLLALLVALAPFAGAQLQIDPAIAAEIAEIKAIDNHAHPVLPAAGDTEYDALPVEHMDPYTEPIRMRAGSPIVAEASRRLFDHPQKSEGYPSWVLDQLGIETMLANRISLGPGVAPPRFLWVPFEDALLFPLDNRALAINADRKAFFEDEDRLLARYLKECGYTKPPASLGEYLQKIVDPTLERHKRGGAVAVKFEAAYLRSLDFRRRSSRRSGSSLRAPAALQETSGFPVSSHSGRSWAPGNGGASARVLGPWWLFPYRGN